MKIKQYTVLDGYSSDELSKKVNSAISKHWQPYGSMCFYPKIGLARSWFYQPMVLMEDGETNMQEGDSD
jgi:Domain of unknown function (DUF1737)